MGDKQVKKTPQEFKDKNQVVEDWNQDGID